MTEPPPPRLRSTVTEQERRQIVEVLGPVADLELLRAVRDGRGRTFQRLELIGDSVLDVVLTAHRWAEPRCMPCRSAPAEGAASDRRLAADARASGLGRWLEWEASDHRMADLVETCVAVCRQSGGWDQAGRFVARFVHPLGRATVLALTSGRPGLEPGRTARRVGAACLELAAAELVAEAWPESDEGELSSRRAQIHRASRVAAVARRDRPEWRGDDEAVLSRVEDAVAAALGVGGADAALQLARQFVPLGEGTGPR